MDKMREILEFKVPEDGAALWHIGQAGYIARSCGVTVVIDPYLTDSVGKASPEYSRAVPVPVEPGELEADLFIVTHDHADHLDPDTVAGYAHKRETLFVAPRLAARKLVKLGVPQRNVRRIDSGEEATVAGVKVAGIYAAPTGADVIDTTGYRCEFSNGRSFYHTSDTASSQVLLDAAPKAEVLLVCINGKWGNLDAGEATQLAAAVGPRYAIPNHYDMMVLNTADPEDFVAQAARVCPSVNVRILEVLEPFTW